MPEAKVQLLSAEQFMNMTKMKTQKVKSAESYVDGGRTTVRLPQAGLGHRLWVILQGTITVGGTVTSGTFQTTPAPAPLSIFKRVRFGSNTSLSLRDLSGWSWYKWLRERYGIDPLSSATGATRSANNIAALGVPNSATVMVPGANVAAATYNVNLALPMPLSYNNAGEQGLIVLQQNSVFYDLTIDWAQISGGISGTGGTNDIFNALVGTSLVITPALTLTVGLEWFEPLPGIDNLVSMFMSVTDQVAITPLAAGENIVKLPVMDYYTMLILEVINNGAAVAVANIQSPSFSHSGNVYDTQDDYLTRLAMSYYDKNLPPVDGTLTWDMGLRRGLIGRRDTIDAFNNQNITDAQLRFTLPTTLSITGVNQCNLVMEALRGFRQI